MKQLDVDVSPPANIMNFRLGLSHVTFDLDPRDLKMAKNEVLSSCESAHGQTDRHMDALTHTHTHGTDNITSSANTGGNDLETYVCGLEDDTMHDFDFKEQGVLLY